MTLVSCLSPEPPGLPQGTGPGPSSIPTSSPSPLGGQCRRHVGGPGGQHAPRPWSTRGALTARTRSIGHSHVVQARKRKNRNLKPPWAPYEDEHEGRKKGRKIRSRGWHRVTQGGRAQPTERTKQAGRATLGMPGAPKGRAPETPPPSDLPSWTLQLFTVHTNLQDLPGGCRLPATTRAGHLHYLLPQFLNSLSWDDAIGPLRKLTALLQFCYLSR